jgi:hypothetical protein
MGGVAEATFDGLIACFKPASRSPSGSFTEFMVHLQIDYHLPLSVGTTGALRHIPLLRIIMPLFGPMLRHWEDSSLQLKTMPVKA